MSTFFSINVNDFVDVCNVGAALLAGISRFTYIRANDITIANAAALAQFAHDIAAYCTVSLIE